MIIADKPLHNLALLSKDITVSLEVNKARCTLIENPMLTNNKRQCKPHNCLCTHANYNYI